MSFDDLLNNFRGAVKEAGYILTERNFNAALELFHLCHQDNDAFNALRDRAKEFGRREFFLNVDSDGKAANIPPTVLDKFRQELHTKPKFGEWFREAELPIPDSKVLLPARWLCHFAGLRHRCAHIFVDDPNFQDCTLVQLRSFSRPDSPGCIDIPVGGHAKGTEEIVATAAKELKEELDLDPLDFEELNENSIIGRYPHDEPPKRPDFHNIEHRVVFATSIRPPGLDRIRFRDKEVASILVIRLPELVTLMEKFPDRVASGLVGSFPVYLEARFKALEDDMLAIEEFLKRLKKVTFH